ncbi:iron complex transport system substrate-binding protein [[Luteovulum] sphaeroides subsp. megalophilum]|uniref:siderophore ABC transporter substrate-binding protein n=1 Tax=Cereibacter sphaeroides TaxID=1063 RepID=UPI000B6E1C93|nr:siderophore ABC transporter substrate-binding protein [Cereibacter sphaeroides]SNS94245.1 iron complex transport system substrate-binding protein [[Luteovulum] sphaeroides subsp. megalophilum]
MIRFASGLLAGLFLALPAVAETTIDTARGPVSVAAVPETVAVYDVAALDTLVALGITPAGTPERVLVPYLQETAKEAAPVGTLFEPDLEALSMLAPDLVIAGGRSAPQIAQLERVAPTLDMTIGPDLLTDARARLQAYGRLFGREARAAELEAALEARLSEVRAAAEGKGTALVLLTNGPKLSAYGRGSRFGWIHEATGLPEAVAGLAAATHGDAVSFEFIAEADPDWLLVVDRGAAIGAEGTSAQAVLDNPLVAGTTAWKKGQVIYLDPAEVYVAGGGYRAMTAVLDQLIAALGKG